MTLEQIHFNQIKSLTAEVSKFNSLIENSHFQYLFSYLKYLKIDDKVILQALDPLSSTSLTFSSIKSWRLNENEIIYSCDSGSTNPIISDDGICIDISNCAIASVPSNILIQKKRSLVMIVALLNKDNEYHIYKFKKWTYFDNNDARSIILEINLQSFKEKEKNLINDILVYFSESEHLLWILSNLNLSNSFFILDGPYLPKHLLFLLLKKFNFLNLDCDTIIKKIIQNYYIIVDEFISSNTPLIGFVKNPNETQIINGIKKIEKIKIPWENDTQFFKYFLLNYNKRNITNGTILYTNWFLISNQYYDLSILQNELPSIYSNLKYKYDN